MEFRTPVVLQTAGILMLVCATADMIGVRLVDGDNHCSGTPEVLHQGAWREVSSKTFDVRAATVVCRELDCGTGVKVTAASQTSARAVVKTVIDCTGRESAVSQCIQRTCDDKADVEDLFNIRTVLVCSDSVRLVDGAGLCSGRVEVKSDTTWTAVCGADFDWQDAEVVCREQGCGRPLTLQGALFGEGKRPFGTREFQCKGTEKGLHTCSTSTREEHHTCTGGGAVGLTCSGPDDVRLVAGSSRCAGTVEMFHSGKWRRVRAEMWSRREAAVVCRQLDCGSAVAVKLANAFANEPGWSVLTDCEGSEPALRECATFVYLPTKILAAVTCSDSVRLVDGAGLCSGRVEVKSDTTWTTVCEADFDWQDAEVVCRELGCGRPLTLQGALFGERKLPFGTERFKCKGTEKSLNSCKTSAREGQSCTRASAAGLTCSEPYAVRLVDGISRCAGTVEVFHSGGWRRVVADRWTTTEAAVVCRELDCGTNVSSGIIWSGEDETRQDVWMNCKRWSSSLRECTVLGVSSAEYVTDVVCSDLLEKPTISLSAPIRVSRGLQKSEVFRGHSFTITCSTKPQYPGGSFHLRLPCTNRNLSQTAVNHSASFLFPAADDSHQGNYSCIYENQIDFIDSTDGDMFFFLMVTFNFSSESELLSLTITDSPVPAVITRMLLVPLLLLISCSVIFLIFKKWGHILVRNPSGQQGAAAAVQYEIIEVACSSDKTAWRGERGGGGEEAGQELACLSA